MSGIGGGRADEAEAVLLQLLGQGLRPRGGGDVGHAAQGGRSGSAWRQTIAARPPGRSRAARALAIVASILRAVADDGRVGHQPLDVGAPNAATFSGSKPRTRRGSPRACAGSSATTGRTGTPRGRAARRARGRRGPDGPTRHRGRRRSRASDAAQGSAPARPRPESRSHSPVLPHGCDRTARRRSRPCMNALTTGPATSQAARPRGPSGRSTLRPDDAAAGALRDDLEERLAAHDAAGVPDRDAAAGAPVGDHHGVEEADRADPVHARARRRPCRRLRHG